MFWCIFHNDMAYLLEFRYCAFCFDLLLSQPPSRALAAIAAATVTILSFRFVSKLIWRFTMRQHRLYTCWMTLHLKGLPNRLEKNGLCMHATLCRCARKKSILHVVLRLTSIIMFVNKMCKMRKLSSGFELEFLICIGVYYTYLKPFL